MYSSRIVTSFGLLVIFLSSWSFLPVHSLSAQGRNEVVVQTGDSANGDGFHGRLTLGQLNGLGQVSYSSFQMTGTSNGASNDQGMYLYHGFGFSQQIAREGGSLSDGNFGETLFHSLNENGQLAILVGLTGTSGGGFDNRGLFLFDGSSVNEIARKGDSAASNGNFGFFRDFSLNDLGQVSFRSSGMTGTSGGTADDQGIFLATGSTIVEVVREGDAAPSNGNLGIEFQGTLNNLGQVFFESSGMTGTSGGLADDNGLFVYQNSTIAEIAREGSPAPSNGDFGHIGLSFRANDVGQVAFGSSGMTGTSGGTSDDSGIFLWGPPGVFEIVRKGDATENGNYGHFDHLLELNDNGSVLFESSMTGTIGGSLDNRAVFLYDGSDVREIVRKGDSAAGNGTFDAFTRLKLNDGGQVAFGSRLKNSSQGTVDDLGVLFLTVLRPSRLLVKVI